MDLLVAAWFLGRGARRGRHWRRLRRDRQVRHVVVVFRKGSRHRQLRVERILVTGRHTRRRHVRLQTQLLVLIREELRLEFWNAHGRGTARGYLCALRTNAAEILFRFYVWTRVERLRVFRCHEREMRYCKMLIGYLGLSIINISTIFCIRLLCGLND